MKLKKSPILYSARECRNKTASLVVGEEEKVTFPSPVTTKLLGDFGVIVLNIVSEYHLKIDEKSKKLLVRI